MESRDISKKDYPRFGDQLDLVGQRGQTQQKFLTQARRDNRKGSYKIEL